MEDTTDKTNRGVMNYKEKKRTEEEKKEAIHHKLEPIKRPGVYVVSPDNIEDYNRINIENKKAVKSRKVYQEATLFLGHIKMTMSSDKFNDAEREIINLLREHFNVQDRLTVSSFSEKADESLENGMALLRYLFILDNAPEFVQWFEDVVLEDGNEEMYKTKIQIMKKYAGMSQEIRHTIQEQARACLPSQSLMGRIKKFFRRA